VIIKMGVGKHARKRLTARILAKVVEKKGVKWVVGSICGAGLDLGMIAFYLARGDWESAATWIPFVGPI
jgi:hypothetical protein